MSKMTFNYNNTYLYLKIGMQVDWREKYRINNLHIDVDC